MLHRKKNTCQLMLLFLLMLCCYQPLRAQRVAVKTNTLRWLTASPNVEAEFILGRHFSLNASVAGNPIHADRFQTNFFHLQPEVRYWLNRPMVSHFFGVTAFINSYNMLIDHVHRKGDAWAAGLTYGYSWALNQHWNIEASAGVGILRYRQFKYDHGSQRPSSPNDCHTLPAPVKLSVSVVYVFR